MSDIIVIGGGPAGITAAIYAARAGKKVSVVEMDSVGGQIKYSPLVENYPGIPKLAGSEFADTLLAQAENLGVEIVYGEVSSISREGNTISADVDGEERQAGAVILATGASHRRLGLENEERLIGNGISYCAVCDGAFYEDMEVAVVGGGNTALQDALLLSNTSYHVTIIHRRDEFRGDLKLVEQLKERKNVSFKLCSNVTELVEEDGLFSGVIVTDKDTGAKERLYVDGLFIAIGQIPNTKAFRGTVNMNEEGYIITGEDLMTDMPGVFAAGDCRVKEVRQLTTAVGDGAVAAIEACRFI